MRCLLLMLVLLAGIVPAIAQRKQGHAMIDSLQVELPKHGEDTTRVLLYFGISDEYKSIDRDASLRYADSTIALGSKLRYPYGEGLGYNMRANYYRGTGRTDDALAAFEEALKRFRAAGHKPRIAMAMGNIGIVYADKGDLRKAIQYVEGTVATLRSLGAAMEPARVNTGTRLLGMYHGNLKEYDIAFALLRETLRADSAIGSKPGMMDDYKFMGSLYTDRLQWDSSIAAYRAAEAIARELGRAVDLGIILSKLSSAYAANDDFPNAIATATEVLSLPQGAQEKTGLPLWSLGVVYQRAGRYAEAAQWLRRSIDTATKYGDMSTAGTRMLTLIEVYQLNNEFTRALSVAQQALSLAETYKDTTSISSAYNNIGSLYAAALKDYPAAIANQQRAIAFGLRTDNYIILLNAYNALAGIYADNQPDADSVLHYTALAEPLAERNGRPLARSALYMAKGNALALKGEHLRALDAYLLAKKYADESGIKTQMAQGLGNVGWAHTDVANDTLHPLPAGYGLPRLRKAWRDTGIREMQGTLAMRREMGGAVSIAEALYYITEAQEAGGYYEQALATYKEQIRYRDSAYSSANTKKFLQQELGYAAKKTQDSIRYEGEKRALALQKNASLAALRYDYERRQAGAKTEAERSRFRNEEALRRQQIIDEHNYSAANLERVHQREAAVAKAEADKRADIAAAELKRRQSLVYASYAGGALLLIGAVTALLAWRGKRRAATLIAAEREKSESLLLNILPAAVAEELKTGAAAAARQYDEVSVLFTDFVNFSGLSERLSPQALVQELHECFSAFDAICERHGLEKIKTIGDAYMAVCGLPEAHPRHAKACVAAAIDIRDFVETRLAAAHSGRPETFQIRIGIHSGPVVAGVVGTDKYAYDVWGDTVNTAARMEQHGEPGRINLSAATYALIRQAYPCAYRGELSAKGKGEIGMYFVEAPVTHKTLQTA